MPTQPRSRAPRKTTPPKPDSADDAPIAPEDEPATTVAPPPPLTVYQAIAAVMRDVEAIGKTQENTEQHFKFRGVDQLMNTAQPVMAKHGLVILPHRVKKKDVGLRKTAGNNPRSMYEIRLLVQFKLIGPDGSAEFGEAWGEGVDMGDKGTSKAHTMAYKTFLYELFHIPTAESSQGDPDKHTIEESTVLAPAEEHFNAIRERFAGNEAAQKGFAEWWRDSRPKNVESWTDWTDEQVKAMDAAADAVIERLEAQAAKQAQDAAGEPDTPPATDTAQEAGSDAPAPAEGQGEAASQNATSDEAKEPDAVLPPADSTDAPAEPTAEQQYAADDLGTWLRRIKSVGGTPRAAVALGRIWKDGAERFADEVVEDTAGTKMPLWKLVAAMGYTPAQAGRETE